MQLNLQQLEAKDKFRTWWNTERLVRPFHLQGLAGTGKTSVLEDLTNELGLDVGYTAPTGKAARVISHRLKVEATTVHKRIYRPLSEEMEKIRKTINALRHLIGSDITPNTTRYVEELKGLVLETGPYTTDRFDRDIAPMRDRLEEIKKEGRGVQFVLRDFSSPEELDKMPDVLIIDESSMVSQKMDADLAMYPRPKVFVGDPFQLPPVKDKWAFQDVRPDAFLTQIMRQGEGSGVAQAASDIRFGRKLRAYDPDFSILKRGQLGISGYFDYDMILVGTNDLRRRINTAIRAELDRSNTPIVEGEKLLVLNNQENGLSNGETVIVSRIVNETSHKYVCDLEDKYGDFYPLVDVWKKTLEKGDIPIDAPRSTGHFSFGYAYTVHKAQGSEEDRVLVLNSWGEDRPDYSRWLYTGVSRAAKRCTLIL